MRKRFVVCLNSSTNAQDELFKEFIRNNNFGWWHWLSNVWLLVDPSGEFSSHDIRNELNDIYPGVHKLVLELYGEEDTWSGFGPNKPDKNMFEWLKSNW